MINQTGNFSVISINLLFVSQLFTILLQMSCHQESTETYKEKLIQHLKSKDQFSFRNTYDPTTNKTRQFKLNIPARINDKSQVFLPPFASLSNYSLALSTGNQKLQFRKTKPIQPDQKCNQIKKRRLSPWLQQNVVDAHGMTEQIKVDEPHRQRKYSYMGYDRIAIHQPTDIANAQELKSKESSRSFIQSNESQSGSTGKPQKHIKEEDNAFGQGRNLTGIQKSNQSHKSKNSFVSNISATPRVLKFNSFQHQVQEHPQDFAYSSLRLTTKSMRNINQRPCQAKKYFRNQRKHVPTFIKNLQNKKQTIQSLKITDQMFLNCNKNDPSSNQTEITQNPQLTQSQEQAAPMFTINIKPANKKFSLKDFIIIKPIGKGAFGSCQLAVECNSNTIIVLKALSKQKIRLNSLQTQITRQIKIQSYLQHKHITKLYGFFDDQENIYLIMEYLQGGSLKSLMKGHQLNQKIIASLIYQVCQAIIYLHQNSVIHRDLKPENIFMRGTYAKLGDFGCAVFSQDRRKSIVGCLSYLSPQQLRTQQYDDKIDIWGIGVLTYELLTKVCPFQQDLLKIAQNKDSRLLPKIEYPKHSNISEEAKNFIQRMLVQDPDKRMSLQQAVRHRFITKNVVEEEASSHQH